VKASTADATEEWIKALPTAVWSNQAHTEGTD
jgi:hypothetical protein